MLIKSEKYTQGEFKAVKDLVNVEESLLVSSQMANSLLLLEQHEKMMKDATQAINSKSSETGAKAPEPAAASEDKQTDENETNEASRSQAEEPTEAPPAPAQDENDVLADLNSQLKNLLM